ncbi:MAG: carboxypeptidase-like regulatory domain-containing protein, partial [Planctomycetaceae bacterium]
TLIPGCNYSLHAEGTSVDQVASIARELEIQPGETKDLGVLTLGDDRKFIRVEPSAAEQPDKTGNAEKKTSATGDNNIPLEDLGIGVRVVGPEGEPLNGVSIDVSFPEKVGLRAVTRVGDDGSFRIFGDRQFFERAAREFGRYQATITAAKDGLGSDVRLMMLADLPGSMLELQLQKLIDVHGRIVSAEGQPLPGVEIRIKDISRPATTMEEFIRSAQHDGSTSFEISDKRSFRPNEVFRTDADGRFSIPDVPAEHILSLEPRGSGVPFQLIFVASRSAPDSAAKRGTIGEKSFGNTVYYYAKFTHVAPPSRTIKGIVVDQKTGQPVDEINLHCFANGEQLKTGKDGRFEFTGCIKTDSYPFSVDTFTRPYFNRGMRIKDTPGLDPLEVRIELLQGTTLRGRVTGITGHVAGEVHYNVLYPSPYSDRMVDGSSRPGYSSAAVKADGTFDIQVLPGPGVVAFRAEHDIEGVNDFLSPWITVDDVKTTLKDGFGAVTKDYSVEGPIDFLQVATRAQGIGQVYLPQYHAATLISIGEDETDVAVELVVEKGTSLSGRVVDTDGQPVSKIQIAWLTEYSRDLQPIAGDQFTVRGISPKRPRSVMFFHEDLHQGAILLINGEEDASSPITVKLEPCGAVHGRFVDGKARPLADRLILVYPSSLYPYVYFGPTPWSTRTDKNGEYTIRNLVPGHEYSRYISLEKPNGFLTEKLSKETVKPGETVELGDKVIEILNVE